MAKRQCWHEIRKILHEQQMNGVWNNLDEVYTNIFVGDGDAAMDVTTLKSHGITHVLNMAYGTEATRALTSETVDTDMDWYREHDWHGKFLGLEVVDYPNFDLAKFFAPAVDFIEEAMTNNGKILVHCYAGMSRSATMVVAYLMLKKGLKAKDAVLLISEKRLIYLNSGFIDQVLDLEEVELKKTNNSREN